MGWLVNMLSPELIPLFICYLTAVSIDPRWTGMWGALAKTLPYQSKMPHEKSNLYLMLVLMEILYRTLPIYYAMDISLVE